ncbi:MAG: hypothetical protein KatS3mg105_0473 [Gemmatales bacterium]|nr:MAG: hypothetical protein KatS3mg105_0473 [Gemmatales bacterium]
MGTMSFLLPADIASDRVQELERACVSGGPDNMPWATGVRIEDDRLILTRDVEESGCLVAPWEVDGAGRLMGSSGTLIERSSPYLLQLELARGKVNQLRCQAAEWEHGGLVVPAELARQIREASLQFSRAVACAPEPDADAQALQALALSYRASEALVQQYIEQMFAARHHRQPQLDTALSCRLGAGDANDVPDNYCHSFNHAAITFSWREIEPEQGEHHWEPFDRLLDWAKENKLNVSGGPLIDFSTGGLPEWVLEWHDDLASLAIFMCDFVRAVIHRYKDRVRVWQISHGTNCPRQVHLSEDEMLWLTVQLAESARQVDPNYALVVGLNQPWGEYMAAEDRTHSPLIFADTLIRAGLNVAGIDLELVMGIAPDGSYCRDLLDTSRLIDLYTMLNIPLRVTLGFPSAVDADSNAAEGLTVSLGRWRGDFSLQTQSDWTALFASLCLCKPIVRGVQWTHLSDAKSHLFPHCGLIDHEGNVKPAFDRLKELRQKHLR